MMQRVKQKQESRHHFQEAEYMAAMAKAPVKKPGEGIGFSNVATGQVRPQTIHKSL